MNLVKALLVLVATIILCSAVTLLLDIDWIAAHWLRQLIVAVFTLCLLLLGLWISIQNLINPSQS
jgi:NADH:ubiquinone oxidoreductase subunit 6 (subunit J)